MHHLEGDARFDESLVPAQSVVLCLSFGVPLAVVPGCLLRIDQSNSRKRALVRQVSLMLFRPKIDLLNTLKPTLVMKSTGEFAAPRTHAVRNGVQNPYANFGAAGDAVFPAIRLLQTHTEEADNGL